MGSFARGPRRRIGRLPASSKAYLPPRISPTNTDLYLCLLHTQNAEVIEEARLSVPNPLVVGQDSSELRRARLGSQGEVVGVEYFLRLLVAESADGKRRAGITRALLETLYYAV